MRRTTISTTDPNWMITSISDALVAVDDSYRLRYVNSRAAEIFHQQPKELYGKLIWKIFPNEVNSKLEQHIKTSMETKTSIQTEFYASSLNLWVRMNIYPSSQGIVIYFTDITAYKNFERRLREQARMIDLASEAVLVLDEENKIVFWNKGAEKMYGWSEIETIGQTAYKLLQTQFPITFDELKKIIMTEGHWTGELTHTTKDGRTIIVESNWEIFNHGNKFTFLEVIRDITERKAIENKKDEFMSIAAHELKTPLTSVKAYSQLMDRLLQKGEYDKVKILQRKQLNNINKLNKLVTDLLDVTRIKAGKLELNVSDTNVDSLVDDAIENVQAVTDSHRIIKSGLTDISVPCDPDRIEQVLVNLLTNAVKYSPHADIVEVTVKRNSKEVTIGVIDHGVGIPKSEQGKLFDRYYRIRNSTNAPGLGIGLYLSKEIIEQHDGKIWVASNKKNGSAFYFSLPVRLNT